MEFLGYVTVLIFSVVGGIIWRGYVLSILWGWFVIRIFQIREITITEAIGIALFFSLFKGHSRSPKDDRSAGVKLAEGVCEIFLGPAVSLLAGWIVKHYL